VIAESSLLPELAGEPRVLVVDLEPSPAPIIRRILEEEGVAAETVRSGQAAVARVRPGRLALIILNLSDADPPGAAVALVTGLVRASGATVPLLLDSARWTAEELGRVGVATFLPEPCTGGQLVEAGWRALSRRPPG
jgi:DNA-binding response OmpR family regulator